MISGTEGRSENGPVEDIGRQQDQRGRKSGKKPQKETPFPVLLPHEDQKKRKKQHRIRLLGIDAPESNQAFGQKSKQYLSSLIFNKNVSITYKEKDQYGRILGTIFYENENINLKMVQAGLAWHYV